MLQNLLGLDARRKRLLGKAPDGPLRDFLSVPFPDRDLRIDEASILSVDLETTGLDPAKDQILSMGFISMEHNEIVLASAYHQIIRAHGDLKEDNVVIHQITDTAKAQGAFLEKVIEDLLAALAGKVMLVHFAHIEKNFLERACKQIYGMAPVFPIIDTLAIAKKRFDKKGLPYKPTELRLSSLRNAHKLPLHYPHNALNDALATAELLMAEVEYMRFEQSPALKLLLS
jgi:DNA polymerase-3 subunit epsilon